MQISVSTLVKECAHRVEIKTVEMACKNAETFLRQGLFIEIFEDCEPLYSQRLLVVNTITRGMPRQHKFQ